MKDLKKLSKITTRYTNKEGIAHPTNQKHDFKSNNCWPLIIFIKVFYTRNRSVY